MNLHKVLSHPVRVIALRQIEELGTASPVQVTQRAKQIDDEINLSQVAYHFRELAKLGLIEIVNHVQRRGATEHVYRIRPGSPVLVLLRLTEWMEALTMPSVSDSPHTGFASGSGPVSIVPIEVDRSGQEKLAELLDETRASLEELTRAYRIGDGSSDAEPVAMLIGLAAYEVPSKDSASPDHPTPQA